MYHPDTGLEEVRQCFLGLIYDSSDEEAPACLEFGV